MASKVSFLFKMLVLVTQSPRLSHSFPLDSRDFLSAAQGDLSSSDMITVTEVLTYDLSLTETQTIVVQATPSVDQPSTPSYFATSPFLLPAPVTEVLTVTQTVMEPLTTTATVSLSPSTITELITAVPSTSASTSTSPTPPSVQTAWAAPNSFSDLGPFDVTYFPYGQQNLQIVNDFTPSVSDSSSETSLNASAATLDSNVSEPGNTSILQLFYPENSVNPGSNPQGGADFYGTPLDLSQAENVTLQYSVWFPADFDFALGGKLPGIYGGHTGCSGGDSAITCFSTRLMWRSEGTGELYLYAPKDRQTESLCSTPPLSVCDADYGLSIGRGSFNFTPGAWTNIRQTITLNTPGEQDGGFVLEVNDREAIRRSDVYYRDAVSGLQRTSPTTTAPPTASNSPTDNPNPATPPASSSEPQEDGLNGVLDNLLGSVAHGLVDVESVSTNSVNPDIAGFSEMVQQSEYQPESIGSTYRDYNTLVAATSSSVFDDQTWATYTTPAAATVTSTEIVTTTVYQATGFGTEGFTLSHASTKPIGFTGLFFSTFFGGHEARFASPKDQYSWFKGFSIKINDASRT
ncbi:hypothetical protein C8Q75DRAFT_750682 [Abortiporus biennis]|nr:hypothetical protein C8Q75DRAFT_750682 [Abortiporus biennis]